MTTNDIALVTGARGGIGRALVARLRSRGLRVAAVGRDMATLADVPADAHIAADTTTPEGAAAAFAACREQLGAAPSWLAHAVGSTLIAPLHRTQAEQAREVLRINLESSLWGRIGLPCRREEPTTTGLARTGRFRWLTCWSAPNKVQRTLPAAPPPAQSFPQAPRTSTHELLYSVSSPKATGPGSQVSAPGAVVEYVSE